MWKWRDYEFDVVKCSIEIADLKEGETLLPISLHDLYGDVVCIADNVGQPSISSEDIQQGSLGDCWLLSGLAAIADKFPSEIPRCIVYSAPDHDYTIVKLHNTYIAVDHVIPVVFKNGTPVRALAPKLSGEREYWPIVVEKAFIKYFGSGLCHVECTLMNKHKRMNRRVRTSGYHYSDIHGGFPRWVFMIIFGVNLQSLNTASQGSSWVDVLGRPGLVACACTSLEQNDSVLDQGFVYGHAYSILGVDPQRKLIRVRNPWGQYENTDYDDGVNDGAFWVNEQVFRKRFPTICLLYRQVARVR